MPTVPAVQQQQPQRIQDVAAPPRLGSRQDLQRSLDVAGETAVPGVSDLASARDAYLSGSQIVPALREGRYGDAIKAFLGSTAAAVGALPMVPSLAGVIKAFHATDAADDFARIEGGARKAFYVAETPEAAVRGARAGRRERGGAGGSMRVMPMEVTGSVAYRDKPPGFEFPDTMRGPDGYYDEAKYEQIKQRIEVFSPPGLSKEETEYARNYLRQTLEGSYDEVTGEARKVSGRTLPEPNWTEFERGLGAHERGYESGAFSVVGAKTPPETIRNALRSLGYEASLVGDEGGRSIAVFSAQAGGPITAVRPASERAAEGLSALADPAAWMK